MQMEGFLRQDFEKLSIKIWLLQCGCGVLLLGSRE